MLYNRLTAKDNTQAIKHLEKASETSNEVLRALAFGELSRAYSQQVYRYGHKKEPWLHLAEETSSKAVQLAPNLEETWLARGFALHQCKCIQEALKAYQEVIRLPGDSLPERCLKSQALNNTGEAYMKEFGDLKTAIMFFNKALELYEFNKMAHANLGEAYKRMKKYEEAINEYLEALRLDPRYINAHNLMGMVYLAKFRDALDNGNQPECKELLDKACEYHNMAVILVSEQPYQYRAELHRKFAEACQQYGLQQQAKHELDEVKDLNRMMELEKQEIKV